MDIPKEFFPVLLVQIALFLGLWMALKRLWFDPALNLPQSGVPMGKPWVWWDNFAIPPGGWVKMLTRFVDYTGTYVFHCHILGHEDRGMMELVNVSPSGTSMKHK